MGAYAKDFQHITIRLIACELVAGAIEAKHKLLWRTVRMRRTRVLSHDVGLSRTQLGLSDGTRTIYAIEIHSATKSTQAHHERQGFGEEESANREIPSNRIGRIRMFAACHLPRRSLQAGRKNTSSSKWAASWWVVMGGGGLAHSKC